MQQGAGAVQVGHVQRQFVLCLLGQSSFSKHLTAVRETNILLKRAVDIRQADQGQSMKVGRETAIRMHQPSLTLASGSRCQQGAGLLFAAASPDQTEAPWPCMAGPAVSSLPRSDCVGFARGM